MMNLKHKVVSLAAVLLLGSFAVPCFAMEKSKKTMAPSSAQSPSGVKMIWDYKDQLGLTEAQVSDIKDAINGFQKEVIRLRSKLQVVELDLQDLVQKKSDITAIKTKLAESADLQVNIRLADIETARKIDSILTEEQVKKWRDVQKKEISRESSMTPKKASTKNP